MPKNIEDRIPPEMEATEAEIAQARESLREHLQDQLGRKPTEKEIENYMELPEPNLGLGGYSEKDSPSGWR
jgi:hypothetical protein